MSLVFAGVCSHAPGITGRKDRADPADEAGAAEDHRRNRIQLVARAEVTVSAVEA